MRLIVLVVYVAMMGFFSAGSRGAYAQAADKDCVDFGSQADAQTYFNANGGSAAYNFNDLDHNHNGWACEDHFGYVTTADGDIPYPSVDFPNYPGPSAPTTVPTDVVVVPTDVVIAPTEVVVPTDVVVVSTEVIVAPTTAPGQPTSVPMVTPTTDPGATPIASNPGTGGPAAPGKPGAGAAVSALPNTGSGNPGTDPGIGWVAVAAASILAVAGIAYRRRHA